MQSPCLRAITSHTLTPCLEPGSRPADVRRNLSNYPVDDLWYDSGISSRTCYSPMAIKCYLMRAQSFALCRAAISLCRRGSFSVEIGRCSEALGKQNLSCLFLCLFIQSAKAPLALVPPRDVPFLEMLILIPITLLQIT